jgi:DNA-binding Lrp family transcriptional regulator
MDTTDRKILAQLQQSGRISLTELSERVGISLSPCQRRVRALEEAGVITEYRARINPLSVGLAFSAIVFSTLRSSSQKDIEAFESALQDIPEIIQAQRLFGDPDHILHIVTRDLNSFQSLYDRKLSALPNVQKITSTLVMKSILENRPFPISS